MRERVMENWLALLFVAAGLFAVAGGVFDWDWFMESRKARFFVTIFGRTSVRIFYVLLGAITCTVGFLAALGSTDLFRK
jgi:drug/metabolite transporter superfamily protein YnfA